jgi:nucleoside-diphosphate-sugar epimerase
MQIAVTGASGELGRALVPYLLQQGHTVVSLDRAIPSVSFVPGVRSARAMVADISDFGQVVSGLRGCDAVIHLAAHRSPVNAPDSVVYIENTASSYNVLSAAPRTVSVLPSLELARQHYPDAAIRGELLGQSGFFNCAKAERVLGWRQED